MRWNRMFWAFTLSFLPTILMFLGGLSTLQTAAIVGGLPLLVISVMLMISAVRATSLDLRHQDAYIEPTINIEELPDMDPWSAEGMALAQFEKEKDAAQEAAELERVAYTELAAVKKEIRAYVLEQGSQMETHELPENLQQALEQAESNLSAAQAKKIELSEQAQNARITFNQVVADLPLA